MSGNLVDKRKDEREERREERDRRGCSECRNVDLIPHYRSEPEACLMLVALGRYRGFTQARTSIDTKGETDSEIIGRQFTAFHCPQPEAGEKWQKHGLLD